MTAARISTAEHAPARPMDLVAEMMTSTATTLRRMLTGEITPPPRAPRLRSVETPAGGTSTAAIALLRIWCVGEIPETLRGAHVSAVPSVDGLASRLAVERAPDVVVVATEAEAEALARVTSRPVVLDGPELRARVRLAFASALTAQLRRQP